MEIHFFYLSPLYSKSIQEKVSWRRCMEHPITVTASAIMLWLGIWKRGGALLSLVPEVPVWSCWEEGGLTKTSLSHKKTSCSGLLCWAISLKVVGSPVMTCHQDLQSFQGVSKKALPVPFALACFGMYGSNTPGLDAGQGQVEQHTPNSIRRGIAAWMCQTGWGVGWHWLSLQLFLALVLCISHTHLPSRERKGKAAGLLCHTCIQCEEAVHLIRNKGVGDADSCS